MFHASQSSPDEQEDPVHKFIIDHIKNYSQENSDKDLNKQRREHKDLDEFKILETVEQNILLDKMVSFKKLKSNFHDFTRYHRKEIDYKANRCVLGLCYRDLKMKSRSIRNCAESCFNDKNKFQNLMDQQTSNKLFYIILRKEFIKRWLYLWFFIFWIQTIYYKATEHMCLKE